MNSFDGFFVDHAVGGKRSVIICGKHLVLHEFSRSNFDAIKDKVSACVYR